MSISSQKDLDFLCLHRIITNRVTGLHNKIFNRMPMPLLRIIGTVLYRHMG